MKKYIFRSIYKPPFVGFLLKVLCVESFSQNSLEISGNVKTVRSKEVSRNFDIKPILTRKWEFPMFQVDLLMSITIFTLIALVYVNKRIKSLSIFYGVISTVV